MEDPITAVMLTVFMGVLCLVALLGVFFAFVGYAQARDPQGWFTWGKRQRTQWLHDWIPSLRWAAPEQQVDVFNQVTRLLGWTQVGIGLGFALGGALAGALGGALINAFPPVSHLGDWNSSLVAFTVPQLYALITCLPVSLGAALAFRLAARAAHRARRPDIGVAPWQPRRARDYHAAWLWRALVAVMSGGALVGVISTLYAAQRPPDFFAPPLSGAAELALLCLSAAMPLALLLFWLTSFWIVAAPPAITTPYSGVTGEAEDYVRAQALTYSQAFLIQCAAYLIFALVGAVFVTSAFEDTPWLWALPAFFMLALVLLIAGTLLSLFRGRLGGRRTGWPGGSRMLAASATPRQG